MGLEETLPLSTELGSTCHARLRTPATIGLMGSVLEMGPLAIEGMQTPCAVSWCQLQPSWQGRGRSARTKSLRRKEREELGL